jgi:hypothetical protein
MLCVFVLSIAKKPLMLSVVMLNVVLHYHYAGCQHVELFLTFVISTQARAFVCVFWCVFGEFLTYVNAGNVANLNKP